MSRIGGVFPFPSQSPATGDGVIVLPSGGVYMLPPGNFLVAQGTQTQLQWFDPNQLAWRLVIQSIAIMTFVSCDGTNYRLVNLSGVVMGASITNVGSGATNGIGSVATGVNVTFAAPPAGGALATATAYPIVGGSVQAPTIVSGGSGFLVPPIIMIDPPPPGGVQATATATISAAGVVTAITMQNVGAGYTSSPIFYVIPQPALYQGSPIAGIGPGASPPPGLVFQGNTAQSIFQPNISAAGCQLSSNALTGSGTLTGIGILSYGANYTGTTIPAVTITGAGAAAATAIMSLTLISVTLTAGGTGYGAGNPPLWETNQALVSAGWNNQIPAPRNARGIAVVAGGAVASFTVEDPGFGFQRVPFVTVEPTSVIPTVQATGTPVLGGLADTSIIQGRVQ